MIETYQETSTEDNSALVRSRHQPAMEATLLEPAVLPSFGGAVRGYHRREVDDYVDYQRHRLAAMRSRALRAERELAEVSRERRQWNGVGEVRAIERFPAASTLVLEPAADGSGSVFTAQRAFNVERGHKIHLCIEQRQHRERLRRFGRYGASSLLSILLTEVLLALFYGELRLASATTCSLLASGIAAVPTYVLYRRYVWRRRGRSQSRNEVIPFWITTAIGVTLSTLAVGAATHVIGHYAFGSSLERAAVVDGASVGSFGLLWMARYVVFDRWVFGARLYETTKAQGAA